MAARNDAVRTCGAPRTSVVRKIALRPVERIVGVQSAPGERIRDPVGTEPQRGGEGDEARSTADVYALGRIISELHCGGVYDRLAHRAMQNDEKRRPASAIAMNEMLGRMRRRNRVIARAAIGAALVLATLAWWRIGSANETKNTKVPAAPNETTAPTDSSPKVTEFVIPQATVKIGTIDKINGPGTADGGRCAELERRHDQLLEELADAYDRGAQELEAMMTDETLSLGDLKTNAIKSYGLEESMRFNEFMLTCPEEVLQRHPVEWQTPAGHRAGEALNRLQMVQMKIMNLREHPAKKDTISCAR